MNRYHFASAIIAALCINCAAWAEVHSFSLDPDDFGHTDQNDLGVNHGDASCAATSTVNSFQFLQNTYPDIPGIEDLMDADDPTNTINALNGPDYMNLAEDANGVGASDFALGKTQWIEDHGLADSIEVHGMANGDTGVEGLDDDLDEAGTILGTQENPTLQFIYEQLMAGQDIEMGILWWNPELNDGAGGYNGGHVVTVTGINFDDVTGTGTLDIIDPWGGVELTGSLYPHGDYTQFSYSGGAASDPEDPDNPDGVGTADIVFVAAESPVPEPAFAIVYLGAVGLLLRRRAS